MSEEEAPELKPEAIAADVLAEGSPHDVTLAPASPADEAQIAEAASAPQSINVEVEGTNPGNQGKPPEAVEDYDLAREEAYASEDAMDKVGNIMKSNLPEDAKNELVRSWQEKGDQLAEEAKTRFLEERLEQKERA